MRPSSSWSEGEDMTVAEQAPAVAASGRSSKAGGQLWTRRLHVYSSMIALVLVLFFGLTGITLNHPDWTFGDDPLTSTASGILPDGWSSADDTVDFLAVTEFIRAEYDVSGAVADYGVTGDEAFVTFKGPGYAADLTVDTSDGTFDLVVEELGWVAVVNDLHKGRDTDSSWNWAIDISAGFLVAISLTGLLLQLYLKRRRTAALVTAGVGALVTVVLVLVTLR